ncbi:putative 54S ribosomal protein L32, mitochondrial [Grifola frondosa]|uniref:Large ribosomal subunit protein bL32m n=1 Tax=Grifola frondosa TaxID=5627 RepID=A0A1C7MT42_GRIFR|nr:putative 54S ribosomal protein L32, mitochondrial [Grifola frondosa]
MPQFARPFLAASLLPAFLTPRPISWAFPSLESLLELFPPFLLAVPKKKVSHSRKAMRSANKGLKDKHNLVHCPGCGSPKLAHHLCSNCYSSLSRAWKAKARQEGSSPTSGVPSVVE